MNRKFPALVSLFVGAVFASSAAPLQFTNITPVIFPDGLNSGLSAVAYGGSFNFVAVGESGTFVRGLFNPGENFINPNNWVSNSVGGSTKLQAVAANGTNLFVFSGTSNAVFSSPDGALWSAHHSVFPNTATAAGLAYNNGAFVAVAMAPEIAWTNVPLPNATNWNLATLANLSFLESYRAVSPYGANGFAACGIFGTVRLSTDRGVSFQRFSGGIGQPDLLGIAGNGANLVAVGKTVTGTNGVILVSTNSGANWSNSFTNPKGNTPLNAVAYTGSGFVAAGIGGQIFTSGDAVNWVESTNGPNGLPAGFSTNLFGVAFATSGYLQGVGMLVGTSGTIILGAEVPPAPTNNGDTNRCEGTPLAESPLSVTIVNDANHPPGSITVDWYMEQPGTTNQIPVPGGKNTISIIPTNDLPHNSCTQSNYYYFAEARDLRTGFVSTNRQKVILTINPRPTSTLTSVNVTQCNDGTSFTITNRLTGYGPWVITWNDGTTETNATAGCPVIHTRTVYPTNSSDVCGVSNNVYYVTRLMDSNSCGADPTKGDLQGTNTVTVNPRPTSTLTSVNRTNCNDGTPYVISTQLKGIGPWVITWNDGTRETNATAGCPVVHTRTVYPTNFSDVCGVSNNVYYVTALRDGNDCIADSTKGDLQGTNTVTVNPRPTSRLTSVNRTQCNDGTPYLISTELKGAGPWVITWNDGTRETNATSGCPVVHTRTVYPTNFSNVCGVSNNVYYVTALRDGNDCVADSTKGDLLGTNTVTVNPRPTSTLTSVNRTQCNDGTPYVISTQLKGTGPWVITWNDGATETNATAGCPVIHTRTVYPTNSSDVCGVSNNVYFVTVLRDGNGCIADSTKGDIQGTNTVTVNPRPTSTLASVNRTQCNDGTPYLISTQLKGVGPWVITWNDGTVETNATAGCPVVHTRTVYPTNFSNVCSVSNNIYYVSVLRDGNGCVADSTKGDLQGTNTVTVNPRPTSTLTSVNRTNCNDGTPYVISSQLKGTAPWVITWNDGTVETNTTAGCPVVHTRTVFPTNSAFANIPSDYVYFVTNLSDGNGCVADSTKGDLQGANIVRVNPRPTSVLTSLDTTNCNLGTAYTLTNVLTGLGPWTVTWSSNGQSVVQVVGGAVAGPYTNLYTVVPTNIFENAAYTNIYFVQSVSNSATTCTGNQPGDINGLVSVLINPRPTSVLTSLVTTNCNLGTAYTLTNILTGLGPWTVTWSSNGQSVVQEVVGAVAGPYTNLYTVVPTNIFENAAYTNIYFVQSVSNSATTCTGNQPGDLNGLVSVLINPRPISVLTSPDTTNCNLGTAYTLTNILTGLGPWTVTWSSNDQSVVQVVGGAVAGPYTNLYTVVPTNIFENSAYTNIYFVQSVSNSATTCTGNQPGDINGLVSVLINPRPTSVLTSLDTTNCNLGTAYTLTNILTGLGPWTVTWSSNGQSVVQEVVGAVVGPYTNLYTVVPTNTFENSAYTNIYFVQSVSNSATTCTGNQPGDVTGQVRIVILSLPPAPTNAIGWTNVLTAPNEMNLPLQVSTTNSSPDIGLVTVNWYGDATATLLLPQGFATNNYVPTNTLSGTYTNFAQASNSCGVSAVTPVVFQLIPPAPIDTSTNHAKCSGGEITLSVSVLTNADNPTNLIANWFLTPMDGTAFLTNSLTYQPTNAAPGSYTNWVETLDVWSGLTSTNRTQITFQVNSNSSMQFSIGTNDLATFNRNANGTSGTRRTYNVVSNAPDGYYYLQTDFQSNGTNNLHITNRFTFAGTSPFIGVLRQVRSDSNGLNTTNNYPFTNNALLATPVITNVITRSSLGTIFTISIVAFDTNNACASPPTNTVTIVVNGNPSVSLGIVGQDDNQITVCNGSVVTNQVDLVAGIGTWIIDWNDGVRQTNTGVITSPTIITYTNGNGTWTAPPGVTKIMVEVWGGGGGGDNGNARGGGGGGAYARKNNFPVTSGSNYSYTVGIGGAGNGGDGGSSIFINASTLIAAGGQGGNNGIGGFGGAAGTTGDANFAGGKAANGANNLGGGGGGSGGMAADGNAATNSNGAAAVVGGGFGGNGGINVNGSPGGAPGGGGGGGDGNSLGGVGNAGQIRITYNNYDYPPIYRVVTNTNPGITPTNYLYWVTNLVVTNTAGVYTTNALTTNAIGSLLITVNPTPTVTTVTNQTQAVYHDQFTADVGFGGTATSFTWVNSDTNIGLAASGTNDIAPFQAKNSGTNPVTATITVTPHYSANGVDCTGTTTNISITVNPLPQLYFSQSGTNVTLQWYGNYVLQGTTNFENPLINTIWMNIITQGGSPFTWYSTNLPPPQPPIEFFRLRSP